MAIELEIKLTLHPKTLPQALAWLSAQPEARMGARHPLINRYYDTPNNELNQQRIALRLRQAGDRTIQTLKTQGEFVNGAHRRNEWEWQVPGPHLQLGLLADTPLADNVNLAQLKTVFETNFQRQVIMLEDEGAVIEVAVDSGEILAGGQSRALCEVEFELKSGNPNRLLDWAQKLAQQCPVFLNLVSKAEQGYFLAAESGAKHSGEPAANAPVADAQVDPLTNLLHCLSQSWLQGQTVDLEKMDIDSLSSQAARCGVGQDWSALVDRLNADVTVSELLSSPSLGQVQLALLQLSANNQPD